MHLTLCLWYLYWENCDYGTLYLQISDCFGYPKLRLWFWWPTILTAVIELSWRHLSTRRYWGSISKISGFIKDTSYCAFLLLYVLSVEVYCAYKNTSPIECKSGDCSGEAALLSRLIRASACSLCIGYQYIYALWTFMYYMYICW